MKGHFHVCLFDEISPSTAVAYFIKEVSYPTLM